MLALCVITVSGGIRFMALTLFVLAACVLCSAMIADAIVERIL